MSFKTNRETGKKFPTKPKLALYYQVMVTHFPEGYEPFTVEYGIAERSMSEIQKTLMRARHDYPQSKAYITTLRLEPNR